MSTPRPAMLVAIVTAPRWPASWMISASRSCCLAFSTLCGTPLARAARRGTRRSRPRSCRPAPAGPSRGAPRCRRRRPRTSRPSSCRSKSFWSLRTIGRFVGIGTTLELVDLVELVRLGGRRAGHAGELLVQAEVVLDRDRRDRDVLGLDLHALLGLDRLVQALRPAPALHDAAGELVDDLDLAVLDDVLDVALVQRLGLERLDQVVDELAVLGRVQVLDRRARARPCARPPRSARPSCASRRPRSRSGIVSVRAIFANV